MPSTKHNPISSSAISPELKSWIDNVLVPALVEEYLAGQETAKGAGAPVDRLLLSPAIGTPSADGAT